LIVVHLLKQLIHYVMMKVKAVPTDFTCTQMQQTWHKSCPLKLKLSHLASSLCCEATLVMLVLTVTG